MEDSIKMPQELDHPLQGYRADVIGMIAQLFEPKFMERSDWATGYRVGLIDTIQMLMGYDMSLRETNELRFYQDREMVLAKLNGHLNSHHLPR